MNKNTAIGNSFSYNRSLIEASLDPLLTIGRNGSITDVNKATEEITGVSRDKLIGDNFSKYFTDPEKAIAGYKKVLAEGSVKDYPLTIQHVSGTKTDVLYNASVYYNQQGEVLGVFAAARDITQLQHAEKEVQLQADLFKTLITTTREGFWRFDQDARILDVNDAYCHMSGYERNELLQLHIADLEAIERPAEINDRIKKITATGFDRFESKHRRKDGSIYDVELSISYWEETSHFLLFCRDITERKVAEQKLQHFNRALITISNINQMMVKTRNEKELQDQVCNILVNEG